MSAVAQVKRRKYSPLRHKIQAIKDGIQIFAQTITKQFDLKIIFRKDDCHTFQNPTTKAHVIVLPELALLERPNMTVEEEQEAEDFLTVIWGKTYHECGHVMYSESSFAEIAYKYGKTKCKNLLNAIEDIRVERQLSDCYPGAKEKLDFTNRYLTTEMLKQWDIKVPSTFQKLCFAFMIVGEHDRPEDNPLWKKIEKPLRRIAKKYRKTIKKGRTGETTQDAWAAAKKIWDRLRLDTESEKMTQEEKEKLQQATEGDEEGESENQQAEADQDQEIDGSSEEIPNLRLGVDEESDKIEDLKKRIIVKKLQEYVKAQLNNKHREYMVYTTEGDVEIVPEISMTTKAVFQSDQVTVRALYGPAKRALESKLNSRSLAIIVHGLHEGDLDRKALYRVRFGQRDIFKRQFEATSLTETVASLWFDVSTSMLHNNKVWLAKMATMVFASALEGINIPFEVVSYSTGHGNIGNDRFRKASTQDQALYARWGDLVLTKFKSFSERWSVVGSRLVDTRIYNNTYDGESVRLACARLLKQRQRRKILFVLSDGDPCPNVYAKVSDHQAYLKEVVAATPGVEIIGIGIMSPSVKDYFTNYVVVNNLAELPKVMADQLGKLLLKNAGRN